MRRSVWDLTIVVLGLNIWASFDLIPALHQLDGAAATGAAGAAPSAATWALMSLAPVLLGLGVLLRQRGLLLGVYPLALLAPVLVDPRLVGVDVHSRASFVIVAASFLAYTFGTAALLRALDGPPPTASCKQLDPAPSPAIWRRRRRMYLALALLAALGPVVLVAVLYLDVGTQRALRQSYPERAAAAGVLFGAFAVGLWLTLFYFYFFVPLREHIRGDRDTEADLLVLRHRLRRAGPRPQFYVWVAVALSLMAVLFLTR